MSSRSILRPRYLQAHLRSDMTVCSERLAGNALASLAAVAVPAAARELAALAEALVVSVTASAARRHPGK